MPSEGTTNVARDHEQRAANYAGFWAGIAARKVETDRLAAERAAEVKAEKRRQREAAE